MKSFLGNKQMEKKQNKKEMGARSFQKKKSSGFCFAQNDAKRREKKCAHKLKTAVQTNT